MPTKLIRKKLNKRNAGCLTDCVARLLNLHPECVPHFVGRKDWPKSLRAFLRKHGLGLNCLHYDAEELKPNTIAIVVGRTKGWQNSKRGKNERHAVLYVGPKLFYDPNGERRPFDGPPLTMWVPYKLRRGAPNSIPASVD